MFLVGLFLLFLMIAPQLWWEPMVGLPVDALMTPLLFVTALGTGRLTSLLRFSMVDKLFLGFILWMSLSAAVNGMTDESKWMITYYLKLFVVYKALGALVDGPARARAFIGIFVLFASILSIEAIQHRLSADHIGWAGQSLGWIDPDARKAGEAGRARWIGIFDGPGVFCVIFTIALPFALQWIGRECRTSRRLLGVGLSALLLAATYYTGSRGGLIATLVVVALTITLRSRMSPRAIAISATVCFLAYSAAPSYMTTIRDQSNSTQYRVEMWASGIDMVKDSPVFGIGRGNFRQFTHRLIAHNSAIEIMGETGLVGLFLWSAIGYLTFASLIAWRAHATDPSDRRFSTGLILALMGYLISSMFVTLEYITYYALVAVSASAARGAGFEWQLRPRDVARIVGGIIVWLVALQLFVIRYMS